MDVTLREAGPDDLEHIKWALYEAVAWNPLRPPPPLEVIIDHPQLARYHRDWMRPGDLGVIALRDDAVVGVAFCRLFTDEDHGEGYFDGRTPELAVAVADGERGRGIGRRLLEELATRARAAGMPRLSLSADGDNPALRLYERLGYRVFSEEDDDVRMVLDLGGADRGSR